jgi:3-dehydroquinate dehydratase/shikimate dehydrogenase
MLEKAAAAAKETPFLEFRLDYLDKPAAAVAKFRQFLAQHTEVTAIATCRREENGGKFTGTLNAQLEILLAAATPAAPGDTQAAFELIDLEVESAEALKPAQLAKLRETGAAFLCSWHDFHSTPDLDAVYARILPFAPDIVKIVPTATSLADNLTLMRFIERVSDTTNIVGICMGEAGSLSRVLGLRAGATFTFAAASAGEETGPGQIAARTLVESYRIDAVDASTKVYGVVGNPVSKSLSPIMMNSAFRRETVNALYLALPTENIKDLIAVIPQIPLQGLSVTMPHKQAILPYLEHMDPLSQKIGAVNTVSRIGGKLYGFNTDVAGILAPLEKRLPVKDAKILVLGAGGSARASVFALRDKGADVTILNRTPETAAALAQASGAHTIDRAALFGKQAKSTFDVILNTTPIGMSGNPAAQILDAADLATLNPKIVFDIVYNPLETPLLTLARNQSIPIITGVEMFVQQGMRQFEIWTGKPAPEEEMLRVVLHALKQ